MLLLLQLSTHDTMSLQACKCSGTAASSFMASCEVELLAFAAKSHSMVNASAAAVPLMMPLVTSKLRPDAADSAMSLLPVPSREPYVDHTVKTINILGTVRADTNVSLKHADASARRDAATRKWTLKACVSSSAMLMTSSCAEGRGPQERNESERAALMSLRAAVVAAAAGAAEPSAAECDDSAAATTQVKTRKVRRLPSSSGRRMADIAKETKQASSHDESKQGYGCNCFGGKVWTRLRGQPRLLPWVKQTLQP